MILLVPFLSQVRHHVAASVRGACAQVPRLDTQQISNEYSALYHAKVLNAPLTSQPYIMQKFFSDLGT
jgi:hypothetical protein